MRMFICDDIANVITNKHSHKHVIGKDDVDDSDIALSDTQINSIQCLNFVKIWFNSIFNSKLFQENSIQKIIQR